MTVDRNALWAELRRLAADFLSPASIGAMVSWQCEYERDDGTYGIVLHGTDPEQVWRDNKDELRNLRILGVHWLRIDARKGDE